MQGGFCWLRTLPELGRRAVRVEYPNLEGFQIQKELGRGARGVVYLAARGDQNFALKLQNSPDDRSLLRFGAILACLRHPGLPYILEVGELDGCPYLVREYISGYTLAAELDAGPLPETRLVEMAKTLAGALNELHRHGLIHRDVKPSNILLPKSGGVRLIDFGFATRLHAHKERTAGTFLYSAPEQTGSLDLPLDQRADLYALGVVMYRCLAGAHPFESEDPGELMRLHASVAAPPLLQASPALAAVVAKLLAKDPADRYQTGLSLLSDLRSLASLNDRLESGQTVQLGEQARQLENVRAPLIGRDSELAELVSILEKALLQGGQSVLLEGEAGSGKSLLLEEFLGQAHRLCPLFLRSRSEGGRTPLGLVRSWLEAYFEFLQQQPQVARQRLETELRAKYTEGTPLWASLSPASARFFEVEGPVQLSHLGDQVLDGLCLFFQEVSLLHSGATLVVEDVAAVDEASLKVLRRLCLSFEQSPLLLLATSRPGQALSRYQEWVNLHKRICLVSLGLAEVELLVFDRLGSRPVSSELIQLIYVRSQGNAFAVTEYLRAMLEAGAVLPAREGWRVDSAHLQKLQLPENLTQLLVRRLSDLGEGLRAQLYIAALLGNEFSLPTLAACLGCSEGQLRPCLESAQQLQVIEVLAVELYWFVHEALREALLSELSSEQRAKLNLQIALGLEKQTAPDPYALAHHYWASQTSEYSQRMVETNLQAGRRALAEVAFEEAYEFLMRVSQSRPEEMEWVEPLSQACEHTGRVEEAINWLERLLKIGLPPVHRAQILIRLTKLRQPKLNRSSARDECQKAMRSLGLRVLDRPVWNALAALFYSLKLILCEATGWGFGRLRQEKVEEEKTLSLLYQVYSEGEYFDMRYVKMLEMAARACLCGFRLGLTPVTVRSYSNFQIFFALLRRRSWLDRWSRRAQGLAEQLGDPVSKSCFEVTRQVALHILGESEEVDERLGKLLTQRAHLLDPYILMVGIADLSWSLLMRGEVREAWHWVQVGMRRCEMTSSPSGIQRDQEILACYALSCLAILGQPGEALLFLDRLRDRCQQESADPSLIANYHAHHLALHLESRDLEAPWEDTGKAFLKLGIPPRLAPLHRRHFYVFWAYGWLERGYRNPLDSAVRQQVLSALELLRATANRPILLCHCLVVEAGSLYLQGLFHESLEYLSRAHHQADLLEAAWPVFEVARLRSRVLAGLRKFNAAAREAERAYRLALELGWSARAKSVARELSLTRPATSAGSNSREMVNLQATPEETLRIRLGRQLDSLLHLSLAASRQSSPYDQTRLVLDELVRLLNAERAYVFLLGPNGLTFFTGRDQHSKTLDVPRQFSRTVIEKVQAERRPLILAGTEQGEILGSRSVIDHNLRSIICAPISLSDELVGVIYLDSRLARGIFSEDDVSLVNALSHHIAVGIEAAKAARLEMEVESERRQRALADVLSEFTMSLSSTLEPEKIVDQLLETLLRAIHFRRATVWMGAPDKLKLVALRGYPPSLRPGRSIVPGEKRGFDRAVELHRPVHEACQGFEPGLEDCSLKGSFSWLAIPLLSEQRVAGVVTLSAEQLDAFSEAEVEVAFTFCNQAGIALANAHLFKEINRLATTDSLTGCYNRRRFFQIAQREMERCRREGIPFCAIMADIDFFKKFNDQYGHACGDEVLQLVSRVLREALGEIGTLGRLGGEEFAVCLAGFDQQAGCAVAEKLRLQVENQRLPHQELTLQVTLSLGVACLAPDEELEPVFARADAQLYEAKRAGRNRVA